MTQTRSPSDHRDLATRRQWIGLAVLVLPVLLIAIDGTVLALALPALSTDLNPTASQQLWIVDIYSFMLAGLLVTLANVGDRIGRRKLLLIGGAGFAAASVLCALAPSAELLILARALLGVAGATLMPTTLSLIRSMFLDRDQRRFAIAVWGAMTSLGVAAGPLVGGFLLEHFWWGSVFLINIPVMALLLVLGPIFLTEHKSAHPGPFDVLSALLSLASMISVVYGFKTIARGEDVPLAVVAIVLGVTLGWALVRRQRRLTHPMINVRLFLNRRFTGAVVTDLLCVFALVGGLFFMAQYLLLVVGLAPLQAALHLIPVMLAAVAGSFGAAWLVKRFAARLLVAAGILVSASGFAFIAGLHSDSGAWPVVAGLSLIALGVSGAQVLTNDIILSAVQPDHAGSAAAISETAFELGTAVGTAVLGTLFLRLYSLNLHAVAGTLPQVPATVLDFSAETISNATVAAGRLGESGAGLIAAAQAAFASAAGTTGLVVAVLLVGVAIWSWVTLRVHVERTRSDG